MDKIVQQREFTVFLDLVQRHGVQDRLNHTAVTVGDHNFVRLDPDWQTLLSPRRLMGKYTVFKLSLQTQILSSLLSELINISIQLINHAEKLIKLTESIFSDG